MTQTVLKKIEQAPATLRDIVQGQMRDAIVEGRFEPGARLVERPLCEQLGVSRTVVRETIRFLEAEGLVEIIPNKGPIVARLNREDASQIYEIRMMLETTAAENCARNITPDLAHRLTSALADLKTATAQGDPSALLKATDIFYRAIFEGAGRDIALEIVQRLTGRISRLRVMTLSQRDRDMQGQDHMTAICEAIVAGDAQAARKAVQRHLKDAARIADSILAETEATD